MTPEAGLAFTRALAGTLRVEPSTVSSDGVLELCELEFKAIRRDTNASAETYVLLDGQFNIRFSEKDGITYSVALGLKDFPGGVSKAHIRPANVFVRAPNGKVAKNSFRRDGAPGFTVVGGPVVGAGQDVLSGIIESSVLEVGFNRKPGGRDVTIVLDLTVADTDITGVMPRRKHRAAQVSEFGTCALRLAEESLETLRK